MKVALVQTRTPATHRAALEHLAPLIEEAAVGGAQLILTPEGSNILQRDRKAFEIEAATFDEDPVARAARSWARAHSVTILLGSVLVKREDGGFANRAALLDPEGDVGATYDKIHMFDVDLPTGERHRESNVYRPGERAVVAQAAGAKLGLTICYDLRFPHLYRRLAKAGAEVLAVPAAFTRPTGEAHWEVLLRARAIETGSFVLAPAQGGTHEDGRRTWGRSMIVDPWGRVIAAFDHDEPGVLFATLDLTAVSQAREAIPSLANERPFEGA